MRRLRRSFVASMLVVHLPLVAFAQTTEPPRAAETTPPSQPPSPQAPPADRPNPEVAPGERPPPGSPVPNAASGEQRMQELELRLRELEEKHRPGASHGNAHDGAAGSDKSAERGGAATPAEKAREKGDKGTTTIALAYGPEGAGVVSADGKFQFRLRPIVQTDAHFFVNDGTNTFLLRRVRPEMEGTVFEYFDWRLTPELAGTPNVLDAYVNVRLYREIQVQAGKFKPPVGFERLMSVSNLPFVERGLPSNLVPIRDIGVQLHGDILGGTLVYAGGLFNGAGDGVNGDNDNNDKKDLAGRIVLRPFQPTFLTALRKLGLGIALTRGTHVGPLPPYRTPVQTTFFQYADGVAAGGTHRRIAPQGFFYLGPFGIFGEYTRSTQIVIAPGRAATLDHDSWQVVGSVFITGEEASPMTVTPKRSLNPRNFGTGAIELVLRYGELRIDRDAFRQGFADSTRSARKAVDWGAGANWHLARNFKLMIDYEHTSFRWGSPTGDRRSEILVLTRLQAAY